MIIGVGCDIVGHSLTVKLKWHSNQKARVRLFSAKELKLLPRKISLQVQFLSGRFAVKEAVLKCLGTGIIDGISLREIETLKDKRNRPIIVLNGRVKKMAIEKKISHWHVSISHTDLHSIALVIAENNNS